MTFKSSIVTDRTNSGRARQVSEKLKFHPLADLLPLLEGEELKRLAEDIRANGLLEPIVLTPDGRILDGRNRFRACRLAKVQPRFETIREPEDEWLALVVSRNIRRRHLTPSQTAAFAAELVSTSHGMNQYTLRGPGNFPVIKQSEIAGLLSIDERLVRDAVKVRRESAKLHALVKSGKVAVDVAARVVRKTPEYLQEFIAEIRAESDPRVAQREIYRQKRLGLIESRTGSGRAKSSSHSRKDIRSILAKLIKDGSRWPIALIDPPWEYDHASLGSKNRSPPYPTMSVEDLKALPIAEIMTEDAVVFLRSPAPKLDAAIDLLRAWCFEYRTCAVWTKDKAGFGYWFRGQHELLLVGRRGDFPRPRAEDCMPSIIVEPRGQHSAKPEAAYELLETYYPTLSKIELFARKPRKVWASVGDEIKGGFVDRIRPSNFSWLLRKAPKLAVRSGTRPLS